MDKRFIFMFKMLKKWRIFWWWILFIVPSATINEKWGLFVATYRVENLTKSTDEVCLVSKNHLQHSKVTLGVVCSHVQNSIIIRLLYAFLYFLEILPEHWSKKNSKIQSLDSHHTKSEPERCLSIVSRSVSKICYHYKYLTYNGFFSTLCEV